NYVSCQPSGATTSTPPAIGTDLSPLYIDLLNSVAGVHFSRRTPSFPRAYSLEQRGPAPSMCCAQGTTCLNLQGLNIPMCYDKFTTNFILADGSYGTISSGEYQSPDGSKANLLTGNYTANGQTGNIYSANESAKPNTATLSIPPQWTGTGVGSAIPISDLASVTVYTTVVPTVIQPTVIPASTVETVISGKTTPVTTDPPSTITAPTTVSVTSVVTSSLAAASTTKHGAAAALGESMTSPFGMGLLSALLYVV
ncbi:hypothetical protein K432DRAFT_278809, partial [Lepidopterella palustris CBS 459.81]